MKRQLILILLAALATCASAKASSLFITLTSGTLSGAPGSVLQFSGTLTNTTGASLFLNADSFNLAGFDPSAIDDSPFFTNAPLSLGPNAATANIALFTITIPNGFSLGDYAGTFQVLGGATANDQTSIGSADFTARVLAAGVPEPSTFSFVLLSTVLLVGFRKRIMGRRV